ncbi:MAG: signal peptidase II [Desulfobacteraceae bacterium 4572_35.1]|nr:MAG: signal peptidase II [Desulfobacteraceae bacterium 4572_35.1]
MVQRYRLLMLVFAIIVPVDQLTKIYIDSTMQLHQSYTVVEHFFNISYVLNTGAAFGILADNTLRVPLLSGVALLALFIILWIFKRVDGRHLQRFALALVFSGAIGNLIDRLRLGAVIDFLDVHWYQYHWPAFNVADSAITVGVALLVLDLWNDERRRVK